MYEFWCYLISVEWQAVTMEGARVRIFFFFSILASHQSYLCGYKTGEWRPTEAILPSRSRFNCPHIHLQIICPRNDIVKVSAEIRLENI